VAKPIPLAAIDEGLQTLQIIGSLRFATAIQLRRTIFDRGSASARQARSRATRTLRQLFDAGYIHRVPVFAPSAISDVIGRQIIHTLAAPGAAAIGLTPRLARSRAPRAGSVLAHDYWLVELGVLAIGGCPAPLTVSHWWNDRVLAARKRKGQLSLATVPDALLVAHHPGLNRDFPWLIELDLGTETVQSTRRRPDVTTKIEGYLDYSGPAFQHEFGMRGTPVVLFVTDSEPRLRSLKAAARRAAARGRMWFTTLERIRGRGAQDDVGPESSIERHSPFWATNWEASTDGEWRNPAVRCGLNASPSQDCPGGWPAKIE
jgi:hypothetical protein